MFIEITSYFFQKGSLIIEGHDLDKINLNENRNEPQTISFVFEPKDLPYLKSFLKRQRRVKENKPLTLGDAVYYTLGTHTQISSKYRNLSY